MGISSGLMFFYDDVSAGGVRIRVFDVGVLLIAGFTLHILIRKGVRRDWGAFLTVYGLYTIYTVCNAAVMTGAKTAIKEAIQFGLFAVFFLAVAKFVASPKATWRFACWFLGSLWLLAFWNAAYHLSLGSISGWKNLGDMKVTHGVVLIVMAAIALALPTRLKRMQRLLWWGLFLVAVLFLFLAGERKAWLAATPSLLLIVLQSDAGGLRWQAVNRILIVGVGTALAVLAIFSLAPFVPYIDKQLTSIGDLIGALAGTQTSATSTLSNQGRLFSLNFAISQFMDHPVFGIGLDNYLRVVQRLPIEEHLQKAPHNELLRIGSEMGIVGLLTYGLMQVTIAVRLGMLSNAIQRLTPDERLRLRIAGGIFAFGFIVNIFLAGGGLNVFFYVLPAGLAYSVRMPRRAPARMRKDSARKSAQHAPGLTAGA